MSKPIVKLESIAKIYETDEMMTHALKDINLEIWEGDYISISGPSGCGKSTLLSILSLLDQASSGTYLLCGENVTSLTADEAANVRNRNIGVVFQSFNLIDELSVFDNVALPLKYSENSYSSEDIESKVLSCLAKVDLSHRKHHRPNQLSGGQQQRVAMARALVCNPDILFVDEPTGNLDSKSGDMVMDLLSALNKEGTTICMVTHDPRYAHLAGKQYKLLDGVFTNVDLCSVVNEQIEL